MCDGWFLTNVYVCVCVRARARGYVNVHSCLCLKEYTAQVNICVLSLLNAHHLCLVERSSFNDEAFTPPNPHEHAEVSKLLLKGNWVTLLPLLLTETSYF